MIRAINTPPTVSTLPKARQRPSRGFRKADILRAMDAVRAGGLSVAVVEIRPDGTFRLCAANEDLKTGGDAFSKWESHL